MEMQDLALKWVRIWADFSRGIIVQGSEQRGLGLGSGPSLGKNITKPPSQPSILCRRESMKIMAVAWPIKLRSVVTCKGIIFGRRGPAQPMTNLSLGKAAVALSKFWASVEQVSTGMPGGARQEGACGLFSQLGS